MAKYRTLGTDTSGRPIRMSPEFADWWADYCDRLGFTPTITQGGWQSGKGASASAGTHEGDALDLRVWDRTNKQVDAMVRVAREMGVAAWLRNQRHGGFDDPHVHMIPGPWAVPAPAALRQWTAYIKGRDGLASNGLDYHPRPAPLITKPPEDDMTSAKDEILAKIDESQREIGLAIRKFNKANAALIRAQFRKLGTEIDKDTEAILRELEKD